MELIGEDHLPAAAELFCGEGITKESLCGYTEKLGVFVKEFRLAVALLVIRHCSVSTAVEFKIKLALPRGKLGVALYLLFESAKEIAGKFDPCLR